MRIRYLELSGHTAADFESYLLVGSFLRFVTHRKPERAVGILRYKARAFINHYTGR